MKLVFIIHLIFVPFFLFGQNIKSISSCDFEGKWIVDSISVFTTLGHIDFPGRRDTINLNFSNHAVFIGGGYFQKGSRVNFKKDGKMTVKQKQKQKQIFNYKILNNNIFFSEKAYLLTFLHSDIFIVEGETYSCNGCHVKMFLRKLSSN